MHCTALKNKLFLFISVILLLTLCGCVKNTPESVQFYSMDTIMQMTAYGKNAETGLAQARKAVEGLDQKLNSTDDTAEISKLQNGDTLSQDILVPLQTAQKIAEATDGALDVTLYPLTDAWGFYNKQYRVPTQEECSRLLQDRGNWSLDGTIYHCAAGTRLDLGSVAKGYAGMCAADVLRQNGVNSAILSLGGNVQTVGLKPNGDRWKVAVADPNDPNASVCTVAIGEGALVTSGSYQRNFTENGKIYHHILDPQTGRPVENDLLSVTVFSKDGTIADGLSTALFVMGQEKAISFYQKTMYEDIDISFEALFITNDKHITFTKGFADGFELTDETYSYTHFVG